MKSILAISFLLVNLVLYSQPCLIGHWPLDGNANDISGNGFHGTVYGAKPEIGIKGLPNTAYRFDGMDDFINIAHDTAFDFSVNDEFSISAYVMVDTLYQHLWYGSGNDIITKWEDTSNFNADQPYAIRMRNQQHSDNGKIWALRRSRVCLEMAENQSKSSIIDSSFHHILFTRASDDSIRLYLDGVLESTEKDITTCATNNTLDLEFGKRGGVKNPSYFKGVIDDVKIFGCALTPEDLCEIDTNLTTTSTSLISNEAYGDTYQWYTCGESSVSILAGETNRVFTPKQSGNYMVIITKGECTDTSVCLEFIKVGIEDYSNSGTIMLYPNPATDILNFNLETNQAVSYSIYNSMGAVVQTGNVIENSVKIESLPQGQYLIRISVVGEFYKIRFLKQ